MGVRAVLLLAAGLLLPADASAQWTSDVSRATFPVQAEAGPTPPTAAPTADLVAAAALGGALGIAPGFLVGARLVCATAKALDSDVTRCGIGNAVLGAAFGSGLGMVVGSHLANDRRGSLIIGALATSAVGIFSLLAAISYDVPGRVAVIIPASMLVTAVAVEQGTSPERPE